ncbi:hypothetical protein FRB93_005905 [Tulasnella sp. JGI-2019a]|nr:hypothetical protein FRB93_005905 [Tulasnella sp. JGI-2019a]
MSGILSTRWELESENILATNMLDTIVPSIAKSVARSASDMREFNHLLRNFLPLTRRSELLEYEHDLRVRQSSVWIFIRDWVLDGLHKFVVQSLRLLDIIESRQVSRAAVAEVTEGVYEQAVITGDRCLSGQNRTTNTGRIYEQLGGVLEVYQAHPVPKADLESSSLLGYIVNMAAGLPPHTSQDDFKRLITLVNQIRTSCDQINTALKELADFFTKLTEQFTQDKMNEGWVAKLNIRDLRERWRRLEEEVTLGNAAVGVSLDQISKLVDPLYVQC